MAETTFNTAAGQTIAREMLICYLNTGTAASPTWSPIGKRVEETSEEYDWNEETKTDRHNRHKPCRSAPFSYEPVFGDRTMPFSAAALSVFLRTTPATSSTSPVFTAPGAVMSGI